MNDELRERARAYGETNRTMGGDGWQMMADFATEQSDIAVKEAVRAERQIIAEKSLP